MKPRQTVVAAVISLTVFPFIGSAQDVRPADAVDVQRFFAFYNFSWFDPLVADPRAARPSLTVPGFTDEFEFSQESGIRWVWDISLGVEAPIVAWRSAGPPAVSDPRLDRWFPKGTWAIGLWTPVSFHMIEDHKDPSAPIINTDYRFGSMLKSRFGLRDDSDGRRPWALAVRIVPFAHESTHLGDEYSLEAQRLFSDRFRRVNVSYEYWEVIGSLETTELVLRAGFHRLYGQDGYYSDHLLGSDRRDFEPTTRNTEPVFGIEWASPHQAADPLDPGSTPQQWAWFGSADVRIKTVYNLRKAPGEEDRGRPAINVALGLRRDPTQRHRFGLRESYLRFYYGVNPHGQLRTQDNFTLVGIGFNFGT